MDERTRRQFLRKIQQPSTTVGATIPEVVELDGEEIQVRETYFELNRREELSEDDLEQVELVLEVLKRKRRQLVVQIESEDLNREAAEAIVSTVHDLDRAIGAFESMTDAGIGEKMHQEELQSAKELLSLIDQSRLP